MRKMALRDRVPGDIERVFMNMDHFCEEHQWNGRAFRCIVDNETALKRKNNNVVDISWDNNTTETLIYTPVQGFPGRLVPNEHVILDDRGMKVLQYNEDEGMYSILLMSNDPKEVARL